MSAVYRVITTLREFVVPGRLERTDDIYLLRISATTDEAFAVQKDVADGKAVGIHAIVGNDVVMPGHTSKVKPRADGARIELACILG